MIIEEFQDIISDLENYFSKKLNDFQLSTWFKRFKYYDDGVLKKSVDFAIDEEKFFPSIENFKKHVSKANILVCAKKVETNQEQRREEGKRERAKNKYGDEVMKACQPLIEARWKGEINSFELAEKMFELDKKYPGIGFKEQALIVYNRETGKNGFAKLDKNAI